MGLLEGIYSRKNKTVWEATLNIANTANGERILYDIDPIKKVEGAVESATTTTTTIIRENTEKSTENAKKVEKFSRKSLAWNKARKKNVKTATKVKRKK